MPRAAALSWHLSIPSAFLAVAFTLRDGQAASLRARASIAAQRMAAAAVATVTTRTM